MSTGIIDQAMNYIADHCEMKTLLWTNPTGTASIGAFDANFPASVSLSQFDEIEICMAPYASSGNCLVYRMDATENATGLLIGFSTALFAFRRYTLKSDKVSFNNSEYTGSYGSQTTTANSGFCVPYKIYGVTLA